MASPWILCTASIMLRHAARQVAGERCAADCFDPVPYPALHSGSARRTVGQGVNSGNKRQRSACCSAPLRSRCRHADTSSAAARPCTGSHSSPASIERALRPLTLICRHATVRAFAALLFALPFLRLLPALQNAVTLFPPPWPFPPYFRLLLLPVDSNQPAAYECRYTLHSAPDPLPRPFSPYPEMT